MKVYVFGGNGFVGKHLTQSLLKNEYNVIICDIKADTNLPPQVEFIQIDITQQESINKISFNSDDIIINLIARQYHEKVPKKNRTEYFESVNTVGVSNILKKMHECGCKNLIQYTTDMVYGKPEYLPVDIKHPLNPFGPYGISKIKAENICKEYREKYGFNITIFRPRMIMGPGRLGILKKLFVLMKYNLPVPTIGNGKNCYQMISVFDCVTATISAMKKGCPNKEFNLGSNNPPEIRMLLKNLIKASGSKSIVIPTPGKLVKLVLSVLGGIGFELMYKEQYMIADENYILDIEETKKELDWEPIYSDGQMIIEAYNEWAE